MGLVVGDFSGDGLCFGWLHLTPMDCYALRPISFFIYSYIFISFFECYAVMVSMVITF